MAWWFAEPTPEDWRSPVINEEQVLAQIEDLRGRIERMIETTIAELSDAVDVINEMEKLIVPSQKEE